MFYILKFINQNIFFYQYQATLTLLTWDKQFFDSEKVGSPSNNNNNNSTEVLIWPLLLWSLNKAKKSFILAKTFFLGLEVFSEQDIVLTLDDIRMFTSGLGLNEDDQDIVVTHLLESTCKAMLLRSAESEKVSFLPFSDLKWQINSFLFVTGNV